MTTERDIDQLLVERVQRGDKKAFELLVTKYQRKLMRLVSRLVRDQAEAVARLHLPFPLLSDEKLALAQALALPTFQVEGATLLKRLTMIVRDGQIVKVFYPVFPPDRNATDVVGWLKQEASPS